MRQAVDQLRAGSSAKRRGAAKRLRALADPAAGPALLESLQVEATDPQTWETQYQMVMALGACHHTRAVAFLEQLVLEQTAYTMLGVALGDALVRIEWTTIGSLTAIDRLMRSKAPAVIDGSFRALAILRLVPDEGLIGRIFDRVETLDPSDHLRFWVAAAAAGWSGPRVVAYLNACLASPRKEIAEVAAASLLGKYTNHRVL